MGKKEVTYRLTLDLARETNACVYGLKLGETGSRVLKITLLENGNVYNIDSDIIPRLRVKKADGKIVYANCTTENNIINFDLSAHKEIYTAVGVAEAEIELYNNGNVLESCRFKIIVEEGTVTDGEIESSDDFSTLKGMEAKINNACIVSISTKKEVEELSKEVDKRAEKNYVDNELKKKADKEYVDNLSIKKKVVSELPTENIRENTIYLVPKENATDDDKYDEFIFIPNEEVKK